MTRVYIPVEEAAKKWIKDSEFWPAYDALEDEFAIASALIKSPGDEETSAEGERGNDN